MFNKITLLREGAMTTAELKKSANELTLKLQQIDAEHQACTETEEEMVEYVLKFSELMKKAPVLFKRATDVERRKMVHLIFTELVLVDGKIESYTPTEGMEWFLRRPVLNGGAMAVELERLRNYHREHAHIAKRYMAIIQDFEPHFVPRTSIELARMSRNLALAT